MVALRYAVRVNGFTGVAITKLDVLNTLPEVKVCVAYRLEGEEFTEMPIRQTVFRRVKPVYRTFPGWEADISGARALHELPTAAREYLEYISDAAGVPLPIISVGPRREETILMGW